MNEVKLRDGTTCDERYACRCRVCESHPRGPAWADERYSMGIYAGRYCEEGWKQSGYRDVDASEFDPAYAGESYDAD